MVEGANHKDLGIVGEVLFLGEGLAGPEETCFELQRGWHWPRVERIGGGEQAKEAGWGEMEELRGHPFIGFNLRERGHHGGQVYSMGQCESALQRQGHLGEELNANLAYLPGKVELCSSTPLSLSCHVTEDASHLPPPALWGTPFPCHSLIWN